MLTKILAPVGLFCGAVQMIVGFSKIPFNTGDMAFGLILITLNGIALTIAWAEGDDDDDC